MAEKHIPVNLTRREMFLINALARHQMELLAIATKCDISQGYVKELTTIMIKTNYLVQEEVDGR